MFFTVVYNSVFANYANGAFNEIGWNGEVLNTLYLPAIPRILLLSALYLLIVVLPLSWLSNKKWSDKKVLSLISFVVVSALCAGILLMSVEPIIATDYFEYGERQEYNKALEAIGYGYTNVMVYLCLVALGLSSWFFTQKKPESADV